MFFFCFFPHGASKKVFPTEGVVCFRLIAAVKSHIFTMTPVGTGSIVIGAQDDGIRLFGFKRNPETWFCVSAHEWLLRQTAVMVDKHKVPSKSLQSSINRAQIHAKTICTARSPCGKQTNRKFCTGLLNSHKRFKKKRKENESSHQI